MHTDTLSKPVPVVNRIVEAGVSLTRIQSFLLCKDHESIPAGLLEVNGINMAEVSAAYESKKPRGDSEHDAKTKELIDTKWEAALLKSQLEEAEQKIKSLVEEQTQMASKQQPAKPDSADEWEDLEETTEPIADESGPAPDAITDPENGSSSSNLLCLKRANFQCQAGELVAVVGFVGSGKSTLINTILGEVRVLSGTNAVKGDLSYFSQVRRRNWRECLHSSCLLTSKLLSIPRRPRHLLF